MFFFFQRLPNSSIVNAELKIVGDFGFDKAKKNVGTDGFVSVSVFSEKCPMAVMRVFRETCGFDTLSVCVDATFHVAIAVVGKRRDERNLRLAPDIVE
jgi:hypothetical protein